MPVEPIPSLPPRPEYPAPHITDVDLKEFIIPLYSRKWYIKFMFKKGIVDAKAWQKCPILSRNYDLSTFEATMDFVTEIAKISQAEDVRFSIKNVVHSFILILDHSVALPHRYIRGQTGLR